MSLRSIPVLAAVFEWRRGVKSQSANASVGGAWRNNNDECQKPCWHPKRHYGTTLWTRNGGSALRMAAWLVHSGFTDKERGPGTDSKIMLCFHPRSDE